MASNSARTLSFFFFKLFRPFELAGEKIVHHQGGDECRDEKILPRIVVLHVQSELVATFNETRQKFVDPKLLLVCQLADGIEESPAPPVQIGAGLNSSWTSGSGEKFAQISVVEVGIGIFVKLSFPRVIGLEL